MAVLTPLLLFILLPLSQSATVDTACRHQTTFPHLSVPVPFSAPTRIRIPLHFHFACDANRRAIGAHRPIVLLMQGSLVRPREYRRLGDALARRGFVVAIPDYTQRNSAQIFGGNPLFQQLLESAKALQCPKNGQFETTRIVSSSLEFLLSRQLRRDIRRSYSVRETLIFGHSHGGAVAQFAFNGLCEPVKRPAQALPENVEQAEFGFRFICEQFKRIPRRVRVLGIVSFEGHNEITGTNFPRKIPFVAINSPFYSESSASFFGKRSYGGRLAQVLVSKANHFGPNDFVTQNNNQKAVCALARLPPEDNFTTTRETQNRVIRTVARITLASYNSFVRREGWKPLKALVGKKKLLIEEVKIQ